jgi:hypothetical protein
VVNALGKITNDLTELPESAFESKIYESPLGSRRVAMRCCLRADVRVGSADLEVDVMFGDRSCGKGTISYSPGGGC